MEVEVRDLADKLAVEQAHTHGLQAVVSAFLEKHPDSPLMEQVTVFSSKGVEGAPKRKYHFTLQQVFDAKAEKNGISNPVMRRHN